MAGLLDASKTPYMLVGSLASSFHGSPRATQDIDIVIDPTSSALSMLVNSLSDGDYYCDADEAREALSRRAQFNVLDFATGWKADLIMRKPRPFSESEFERRVEAVVLGTTVQLASAEDTIVSKLEWSSLGGSDRQLADVAGVVATRADTLNYEYIDKWVEELGLADLWTRARELASGRRDDAAPSGLK